MNSCDDFQELINAALAGEVTADESAALDAHLAACPDCRETAAAWRSQDAALRSGFSALRRRAEGVAQRVLAAQVVAQPARRRLPLNLGRTAMLAASAAVGFLLAFFAFGRQDGPAGSGTNDQAHTSQAVPLARLVAATGEVRTRPNDADDWKAALPGEPLAAGCRLSTPTDVRCEFEIPGAGIVWVNQGSEVEIEPGGGLSLQSGQFYCCPSGKGLDVRAGESRFTCRSGPVQLTREEEGDAVRVAAADEAELEVGNQHKRLTAREQVNIQGAAVALTSPLTNAALETSWVATLLVQRGNQEELSRRVDELCEGLDKLAPSPRCERELRSLGHRCVEPLAAFVRSAESQETPRRRLIAARILCDLAQPWQAPLLIELVDDADSQVRFAACAALRRISGEAVGLSPADNQGAPLVACRTDREEWSRWWRVYCREHPASTVPSLAVAYGVGTNSTTENLSPGAQP